MSLKMPPPQAGGRVASSRRWQPGHDTLAMGMPSLGFILASWACVCSGFTAMTATTRGKKKGSETCVAK